MSDQLTTQASEALGIPSDEISQIEDHEGGYLVVTTDGAQYVVGDHGVCYAVAPTDPYTGAMPVWPLDEVGVLVVLDEDEEDESGSDDNDQTAGDHAELAVLADLSEDDITALELLAEEGLTADDVRALATAVPVPTKGRKGSR